MPTLLDVAKLAKVSKSTAGRVIAGETFGVSEDARTAVIKAIEELHYVKNSVASSMRTKKSMSVLLIIPDITNNFWSEVASAAQEELDKKGYSLILANTNWQRDRELRFIQMIRQKSVDGVLVNAPEMDLETDLAGIDCPLIMLGEREDNSLFPTVGSDSYSATRQALDYLYSKGHRRIGFINPSWLDLEGIKSNIKLKAYTDFLKDKNLEYSKTIVFNQPLSIEGGKNLARQFKQMQNKPTAILTGNDLVAVGFIREAYRIGIRIPQDVSIFGFDDIPLVGMMTPAVSTMAKPKREIGSVAAREILSLINGERIPKKTLLKAELKERETVRALEGL